MKRKEFLFPFSRVDARDYWCYGLFLFHITKIKLVEIVLVLFFLGLYQSILLLFRSL